MEEVGGKGGRGNFEGGGYSPSRMLCIPLGLPIVVDAVVVVVAVVVVAAAVIGPIFGGVTYEPSCPSVFLSIGWSVKISKEGIDTSTSTSIAPKGCICFF